MPRRSRRRRKVGGDGTMKRGLEKTGTAKSKATVSSSAPSPGNDEDARNQALSEVSKRGRSQNLPSSGNGKEEENVSEEGQKSDTARGTEGYVTPATDNSAGRTTRRRGRRLVSTDDGAVPYGKENQLSSTNGDEFKAHSNTCGKEKLFPLLLDPKNKLSLVADASDSHTDEKAAAVQSTGEITPMKSTDERLGMRGRADHHEIMPGKNLCDSDDGEVRAIKITPKDKVTRLEVEKQATGVEDADEGTLRGGRRVSPLMTFGYKAQTSPVKVPDNFIGTKRMLGAELTNKIVTYGKRKKRGAPRLSLLEMRQRGSGGVDEVDVAGAGGEDVGDEDEDKDEDDGKTEKEQTKAEGRAKGNAEDSEEVRKFWEKERRWWKEVDAEVLDEM